MKTTPATSADFEAGASVDQFGMTPLQAKRIARIAVAAHVVIVAHCLACTLADFERLITPEWSNLYVSWLGWTIGPVFWLSLLCPAIVIDLSQRGLLTTISAWSAIIAEVLLTGAEFYVLLPLVQ